MKALNKTQQGEKIELAAGLRQAEDDLNLAIASLNAGLEALKAPVIAAKEAYNAAISDAKSWAETIQADMESHYDDRSEKWQESDAGSAYCDWKDAYGLADLEDQDLEFPAEMEDMSNGFGDMVEDLPDCPD